SSFVAVLYPAIIQLPCPESSVTDIAKSATIKIQISQSGPEETSDNFINSSPQKIETSLLILQYLQCPIFKVINIFPLITEHGIRSCDMRLKSEVFFINQFRLITFFYVYPIFTFFLNRVT